MEKANLNLSSLLLLPAGHDLCNILEYKTIVFLVAVALLEKGVHHSFSYRIERNLRDCEKVSSEKETLALSVKVTEPLKEMQNLLLRKSSLLPNNA